MFKFGKKNRMIPLSINNMDDKRTLAVHKSDIKTRHRANKDLVKVFEDTRKKSNGKYADFTADTKLLAKVVDIDDDDVLMEMSKKQNVEFVKCGTVSAGYDLVQNCDKKKFDRVAILNFADALVPGGLVLYGAPTQEENICRCSNLYETLLECPMYYNMNRVNGGGTYLDIMIYSPNVMVFKDDENYDDIKPLQMDVITCPAPSAFLKDEVADEVFVRRIRKILIAAQKIGVNKIVLGAWGCGAFGQDPRVVGKAFAKVLKKQNAFDDVVFAIKSSEGLDESRNYTEFKKAFDEEYKGGVR